jgi:hypothetical protein
MRHACSSSIHFKMQSPTTELLIENEVIENVPACLEQSPCPPGKCTSIHCALSTANLTKDMLIGVYSFPVGFGLSYTQMRAQVICNHVRVENIPNTPNASGSAAATAIDAAAFRTCAVDANPV